VFKLSHKINNINPIKRTEQLKNKQVEVVKLSSPIPTKLLKKVLEKLKFFNKKGKKANKPEKPRKLYTQVLAPSVGKILKLKENFPSLSAKKIKNIHRTINNSRKSKPKINMITKDPLRKQIIISMSNDNKTKFIASSSTHIVMI